MFSGVTAARLFQRCDRKSRAFEKAARLWLAAVTPCRAGDALRSAFNYGRGSLKMKFNVAVRVLTCTSCASGFAMMSTTFANCRWPGLS